MQAGSRGKSDCLRMHRALAHESSCFSSDREQAHAGIGRDTVADSSANVG